MFRDTFKIVSEYVKMVSKCVKISFGVCVKRLGMREI